MSPEGNDHLFVITGGPGSGKSTLVGAPAAHGFAHVAEAGRAIIREQMAAGGTALPWSDPSVFAALMLGRDLCAYAKAAATPGPVVFDRGIPDVVGYLRLSKLPVPHRAHEAARTLRYNRYVFVAPPWPAIFEQDAERKQTLAEAKATHAVMVETYADYGYTVMPLPLASVDVRMRFVIETVAGRGQATES